MKVIARRRAEASAPCWSPWASSPPLRPVRAVERCVAATLFAWQCAWRNASRSAWWNASRLSSSTLSCSWTCVTSPSSLPSSGVSWPCALLQVNGARILSDNLLTRVLILRLVLSSLLLGAAVEPAFAQSGDVPDAVRERHCRNQRHWRHVRCRCRCFGPTSDHQLAMASLAIGRVMAGGPGKGSLELLVDVTPFFQVRQPDPVRGWSVAPLFVRWNFPPIGERGPRIFGEVSGSLLFTSKPVPVRTTTFNFMDQAGFGVRFEESHGRAWLVGYRFQHISNAGTSETESGREFQFRLCRPQFSPINSGFSPITQKLSVRTRRQTILSTQADCRPEGRHDAVREAGL